MSMMTEDERERILDRMITDWLANDLVYQAMEDGKAKAEYAADVEEHCCNILDEQAFSAKFARGWSEEAGEEF